MEWVYDEKSDSWLCGKDDGGCGVFFENSRWTANVVGLGEIIFLGSFNSKEEAMQAAKLEYKKLTEEVL